MQTNVTNDAVFMLGLITIVRFVVPLLLLGLACWVLLLLPQRRAAALAAITHSTPVVIGQTVTTTDGRVGVVCLVDQNRLIIQLADGSKCQISRYELDVKNHGSF